MTIFSLDKRPKAEKRLTRAIGLAGHGTDTLIFVRNRERQGDKLLRASGHVTLIHADSQSIL